MVSVGPCIETESDSENICLRRYVGPVGFELGQHGEVGLGEA
jgi:hypothetical protein